MKTALVLAATAIATPAFAHPGMHVTSGNFHGGWVIAAVLTITAAAILARRGARS
jgi:hypothetical protein